MNIYEHIAAIGGCVIVIVIALGLVWCAIKLIVEDFNLWKRWRLEDNTVTKEFLAKECTLAYKRGYHSGHYDGYLKIQGK